MRLPTLGKFEFRMKKRGFIFTLDSIAAACIITLLAVTWSISVKSKDSMPYFTYLDKIAMDESLVNTYTANFGYDDFTPNDQNANISCKNYFIVKENNRHNDKDINTYVKCVYDILVRLP
ncbi:MAG: hypothetical protein N3F05_00255 [Candidatus Diapherotrites archaeon]|nr:hypothetical protein [Candidatus Diapherotrites archaeon]